MKRIIHLTTVHGRYDVRIFQKMCRSLVENGFDVTLLVQDGKGNENRDGIKIRDIGKCPPGRIMRIIMSPWRALRFLSVKSADIIHFHDPEILPASIFMKKKTNHIIYDSHEDVPRQIISKYWIPRSVRKIISGIFEKIENSMAQRLDAVVSATPHIAARFSRIHTVSVAINNYPILAEFQPRKETPVFSRTICYIGGIAEKRGSTKLLEALELLKDVTLIMCGSFESQAYEREIRSKPGWRYVDYRGIVDRGEVRNVLSRCEAGIVTLLPTPNYFHSQPVKMYEYMAAGIPIIASDFPLWRRLIEEEDCGICVNPESPCEIAGAISKILSNEKRCREKGKSGRKAIENNYNWANESQQLIRLYRKVIEGKEISKTANAL